MHPRTAAAAATCLFRACASSRSPSSSIIANVCWASSMAHSTSCKSFSQKTERLPTLSDATRSWWLLNSVIEVAPDVNRGLPVSFSPQ